MSVLDSDARKDIYQQLMDERKREANREKRAKKTKEDNNLTLTWLNAMCKASKDPHLGNITLSNTSLITIHPMIFNFSKEFDGLRLLTLRLNNVDLVRIPDELSEYLSSLEVLSLATNQLTVVPDSIIKLTNLQELNLLRNKIEKLPERIGLMGSLQKLLVSGNRLSTLPITFGALNQLQYVDLECNRLAYLPENLDNMTSCVSLNVNNNQLSRLPRCIKDMPSLTSLSAAHNRISYLPQELAECESLRVLRLSSNDIKFLPDHIGNLKKLRELCLDHNHIRMLPIGFHLLTNLRILRLDGNPEMEEPSDDVLCKGAQAVVQYCLMKFKEDETAEMKRIIISMINILRQVHERDLADPAFFQPNVVLGENETADMWFAVQYRYLWDVLIPHLRKIWHQEGGRSGMVSPNGTMLPPTASKDKTWIHSFPYSEAEVNWAFKNFTDSYGLLIRRQKAMFTRCACVDSNGDRLPCVPPKVGFMCLRTCILFKSRIIQLKEKQERSWREYKRKGIADACMRARQEAIDYLKSAAGKEFLNSTSFQQAEEMLTDVGVDRAVTWRTKLAEKRKEYTKKKFERRKRNMLIVIERKTKKLQNELGRVRKDADGLDEGYTKNTLRARIELLEQQLEFSAEHDEIIKLEAKCSAAVKKIDEELFFEEDDSDVDSYISPPSSDDESSEAERIRQKILRREQGKDELKKKAVTDVIVGADGQIISAAEIVKKNKNVNKADQLNKKWNLDGGLTLRKKKTTFEQIENVVDAAIKRLDSFWKASEPQRDRLIRRVRRQLLHIVDVVDIRTRKLYLKANGNFDELQEAIWHELYYQYILYSVGQARRKAELDFNVIDSVRQYWEGTGVEVRLRVTSFVVLR